MKYEYLPPVGLLSSFIVSAGTTLLVLVLGPHVAGQTGGRDRAGLDPR